MRQLGGYGLAGSPTTTDWQWVENPSFTGFRSTNLQAASKSEKERTIRPPASALSIRRLIQWTESKISNPPTTMPFISASLPLDGSVLEAGGERGGLGVSKTFPNPVCTAWGGGQLSQNVCSFPCPPCPALRCVVVLVLLAVSGADTAAFAAAIGGDVGSATAARSRPTGHRQGDALQQRSGNELVHKDPRLVSLPSPCTVSSGWGGGQIPSHDAGRHIKFKIGPACPWPGTTVSYPLHSAWRACQLVSRPANRRAMVLLLLLLSVVSVVLDQRNGCVGGGGGGGGGALSCVHGDAVSSS